MRISRPFGHVMYLHPSSSIKFVRGKVVRNVTIFCLTSSKKYNRINLKFEGPTHFSTFILEKTKFTSRHIVLIKFFFNSSLMDKELRLILTSEDNLCLVYFGHRKKNDGTNASFINTSIDVDAIGYNRMMSSAYRYCWSERSTESDEFYLVFELDYQ